jgi:hypothetical protein
MNEEDDALRKAEKKLAAFFHDTDFDSRLREIFKTSKVEEDTLPVDPGVMASAIRGLYAAFSHRRLSTPFEYCDCCITESMATHWKTSALSEIDADDLWAIMSNVPPTAGTMSDVLYFTPRILEHAATEHCILDLSHAFTSLQQAEAPQTSAVEHEALCEFFEPIWIALRDSNPHHPLGISNVILPTAVLTGDIGYFLDLWVGSDALRTYASRLGFTDAFWAPNSRAHAQLTSWLRSHGMS